MKSVLTEKIKVKDEFIMQPNDLGLKEFCFAAEETVKDGLVLFAMAII